LNLRARCDFYRDLRPVLDVFIARDGHRHSTDDPPSTARVGVLIHSTLIDSAMRRIR